MVLYDHAHALYPADVHLVPRRWGGNNSVQNVSLRSSILLLAGMPEDALADGASRSLRHSRRATLYVKPIHIPRLPTI